MVPRPYLAELLDYLSEIDAEVIVWAASSERYVKQVLQVIDPLGTRISKFIVRSNDWFTNDRFYEKNLFWLKRDMDSTIMIENRAMSIRNCNANAILVEDFLRGEFMDDGKDFPPNDNALKTVKEVVQALEESGMKVSDYLSNPKIRHNEIKEIPCHLAINQLPDEIARGVFFYIGDKYKPSRK
jgi:TFIIF-interacting CTD phosphatase-like protein